MELGAYTGLTVERNQYELTDEDVDTQLERMRERAADYPKVERPVETGDLVIADVRPSSTPGPKPASRARP